MNLLEYIGTHTERGACRCGRCLVRGEDKSFAGHTANLVFFDVAARGEPQREDLLAAVKAHRGVFCSCDPLDGKEHSYIELGGWIGDQGAALQLMGLGSLLGSWDLLTPYTVLGADTPKELADILAGAGYVSVQAKPTETL